VAVAAGGGVTGVVSIALVPPQAAMKEKERRVRTRAAFV
jgi:hypothetical protein